MALISLIVYTEFFIQDDKLLSDQHLWILLITSVTSAKFFSFQDERYNIVEIDNTRSDISF